MARLILQRLGFACLTMVLVSVIAFVGTEALPGDSCTSYLGREATEEGLARCREKRQLDRPIYVKYAEWAGSLLQGDFGTSMNGDRDINEIVAIRLRNTALLAVAASIIGIPLAVILGVLTGLFRDKFIDVSLSTSAIAAMTLPEFVTATVLIYIFSIKLSWFPAIATFPTNASIWEVLPNITLPVITLVLVMTAHILVWCEPASSMSCPATLSRWQSSKACPIGRLSSNMHYPMPSSPRSQ